MSSVQPQLSGRVLFHIGGAGNAERVDVSDLFAQRLASAGLEVDYILFDREPGPTWQSQPWRGARAFVVGASATGGLRGALTNKFKQLWADIRTVQLAASGHYDIIQIRDRFFVAPFALLAARLRGKKFVYWLSYPYPESRLIDAQEGRARIGWATWLLGTLEAWILYRLVLPRVDHAFVQSGQMLRDIAAEGVDATLMTPVPMGVNESLLDLRVEQEHPNTVAYLGTLIRVRRLEMLVEAIALVRKQIPEARLLLVGDGEDPEDRHHIERAVAQFGLGDSVEITGMLPMAEAHALVAQAAVCVSPFYPTPILLSTSPTKISEYLALGRPVVANIHPEQSLVLEQSGAGCCVPWSAPDFAEAIVALLKDPQRAAAMGQRGREWVAENRVYGKIAQDLIPHYQALLR